MNIAFKNFLKSHDIDTDKIDYESLYDSKLSFHENFDNIKQFLKENGMIKQTEHDMPDKKQYDIKCFVENFRINQEKIQKENTLKRIIKSNRERNKNMESKQENKKTNEKKDSIYLNISKSGNGIYIKIGQRFYNGSIKQLLEWAELKKQNPDGKYYGFRMDAIEKTDETESK
jgi:hypothetical protein